MPAALATLALLAAVVGCTSDPVSNLGYDLVDTEIDLVLQPLGAGQTTRYSALDVYEPDLPVAAQEALYLGSQGGTTSSILVNYDFSDIYDETFTAEVFTEENILSVELRLLMLEHYANIPYEEKSDKALPKYYDVFELIAPFDSTAVPGPEPDHEAVNLNTDPEVDPFAAQPRLPLDELVFLDWLTTAGQVGLVVKEGADSEPALTGYSARDNDHGGSSLPDVNADIVLGPALIVALAEPDTNFILAPYADASTFHEIGPAPADPADGFILRTCLRSYPTLHFDLTALPDNAVINRAVLAVANDTLSSFGNLESIVVAELDTTLYDAPADSLLLTELEANAYSVIGMSSLDPSLNHKLEFNVTGAVQRIVNDVYEGTRGFVLAAGEDFFPLYDLASIDPDFYYVQFNFFGTAAADTTLRPRLKITYSLVDDVGLGGQ